MRNHAEIEALVCNLELKLFRAIREGDVDALDAVIAGDFVYRAPGRPDVNKAAFLKNIESIPVEIVAIWSDDMKVSAYPGIAVLTGVQKARIRHQEGTEETGAQAFCDIFAQREGKWLLVLAYSVELTTKLAEGVEGSPVD